ncbi:hypothetical protein PPL_00366 [Heterostelium album PN500]|uniref:LUD domain-containing protein n=1 Tax=Heterostelium pallidum (strain ATCC 26659 / Pp 5 / PN500) TaxID=670386 RepID=D3AW92_HETP5|nr:hypothetical protein PPL_00366 [Heterostelium album PN500]EFA86565.1 hypothetical protein PPL_00366 [Heterostelium album PN500]|eukprot:XP_020438670.1 hypothetical protein PPL_00366 [Heterostelium album PN500]
MLRFDQLFEQEKDFKVDTKRFRNLAPTNLIDETVKNLKQNKFDVTVVDDAQAALEFLEKNIPENVTLMSGGSVTLDEIGFKNYQFTTDKFKNLHADILKEKDPLKADYLRRKALSADYFLSSVSAISKDGKLFVVDASGTRCGGFLTAAKKFKVAVGGMNRTHILIIKKVLGY